MQEVLGWGWLAWTGGGHCLGPVTLDSLLELGVTQIACGERCFLVLTRVGKVYMCPYSNEGQVSV